MSRPLRLVTFNVLHDEVRNSIGPWSARRPLVLDLLRSTNADILCLQEVSDRQRIDLEAALDEFECYAGDESGPTRLPLLLRAFASYFRSTHGDFFDSGELCPIFVRRSRLFGSDRGSFHARPFGKENVPTSGTPHIVNWVHLEEAGTGAHLAVYNTHLGLPGMGAEPTARMLAGRLAEEDGPHTRVLCGDMNAGPNGTVIRTLLSGAEDHGGLFDAWRIAEKRIGVEGTWRAGWRLPAIRIDYVLLRPNLRVIEAETMVGDRDGRFPSDHSALRVDLALAP